MPLLGNEESKCATALEKLQAARAKLEAEAIADQDRVEELRAKLGDAEADALLGQGDAGDIQREIATLEAKAAGRDAARPRLLLRIRGALKDLARAKAAPLREKARKLQAKLDAHLAERGKLLAALKDFSGCDWKISIQPVLAPGQAYAPGDPVKYPPAPHSARMEGEIKTLLAQAGRLEDQAADASKGGRISGATLAELLAVCNDTEKLAPTRASIEMWYSAATRRADAAWAETLLDYPGSQIKPSRELVYSLVWDADGRIDAKASTATNREVRFTFQGGQAA
jgi:hypothetical protein